MRNANDYYYQKLALTSFGIVMGILGALAFIIFMTPLVTLAQVNLFALVWNLMIFSTVLSCLFVAIDADIRVRNGTPKGGDMPRSLQQEALWSKVGIAFNGAFIIFTALYALWVLIARGDSSWSLALPVIAAGAAFFASLTYLCAREQQKEDAAKSIARRN